jgi:YD repeat-containing protein
MKLNSHYSYNELGWLTVVTDPLWQTTAYQYDLNGNQVKRTAPNQLVTTFTYDDLKRMENLFLNMIMQEI